MSGIIVGVAIVAWFLFIASIAVSGDREWRWQRANTEQRLDAVFRNYERTRDEHTRPASDASVTGGSLAGWSDETPLHAAWR